MTNPPFPPNPTIHRDLPYVLNPHERQHLDLYLPAAPSPTPLVIWVHGGAFRMGDKENPPLEVLEQGYALASINYRLSQHAIWPAQLIDCKAAVRWLRAHAAEYNLNPDHFAAWGPSAGGHLVAHVGVTAGLAQFAVGENLEVSDRVQAVVDYFGPTDFLQMDDHRPLPDGMIHNLPDSPESELVGGMITEHPDWVAAANPVTYVTADAAPFLIVHGDADPLVPHHQSELLDAALRAAGVPVTFYTVKEGGHGNFTDPVVPKLTLEFLAKHLRSAVEPATNFWQQYLATLPANHPHRTQPTPPAFAFGDSAELAEELAQLVLAGVKTATCSSLWYIEADGDHIFQPGELSIVLSGAGVPLCMIETVESTIRPFNQVDAQFAFDEGEGDRSLEWWRAAHQRYFGRTLPKANLVPSDDMPVICERFRVIYP